jgi:hypothetical protein
MENDLFDQLEGEVDDTPALDPETDYVEQLVGEDKKFKTVADLARAKVESDRFIEQLKREQAEARAELAERIKMEEFLQRIEAKPSPSGSDTKPTERDEKASAVTPETIEQIIEAREQKRQREENLSEVERRLKETFGVNWKQEVQKKAVSLKLSTKWLTDVGARSPVALYGLLGIEGQQKADTFTPPPRGSVTKPPTGGVVKNHEYFLNLKRQKGESWYWDPKTRQEIWKELQSQGEENFYRK